MSAIPHVSSPGVESRCNDKQNFHTPCTEAGAEGKRNGRIREEEKGRNESKGNERAPR